MNIPLAKTVLKAATYRLLLLLQKDYTHLIDGAGFAHGAAGVLYALVISYNVTDNPAFSKRIKEFIERIDSETIIKESNMTWCRGIPGILMVLSEIKKLYSDGDIIFLFNKLKHILTQYELLLKVNGVSLCHGLAGNLCMLRKLAQNNDYQETKQLGHMNSIFIKNLNIKDLSKEKPLGQTTKLYNFSVEGFMLGTSGALYEALAIVNDKIPNTLMLEFFH